MRKISRLLVRPAAWWIVSVVSPVADAFWALAVWLGLRLWPAYAVRLANFLQMRLVPFLLLDFLAWPVAHAYLRAKWKAEERGQA